MNIKILKKVKELIYIKLKTNRSIIHILKDFTIKNEEIEVKSNGYLLYSNLNYKKNDDPENINLYYLDSNRKIECSHFYKGGSYEIEEIICICGCRYDGYVIGGMYRRKRT